MKVVHVAPLFRVADLHRNSRTKQTGGTMHPWAAASTYNSRSVFSKV
ncbi:hypothetical protein BH10BDE1_BH10BDE1_16990 [soil metagenome]